MTEAEEVAITLSEGYRKSLHKMASPSIDNAREYIKLRNPNWKEWYSFTMLDNIAEALHNFNK